MAYEKTYLAFLLLCKLVLVMVIIYCAINRETLLLCGSILAYVLATFLFYLEINKI